MPLCQYMSMFALKAVLLALFGNQMKDDQEVLKFERRYSVVSVISTVELSYHGCLELVLESLGTKPHSCRFGIV